MSINTHHRIGNGPHRVICLHGWFGCARGWGPFADMLDGDAFSYAFMDYRGYGASQDKTGRFDIEEIAADTLALADALGWERFSLIGHSMGGMAIQRVLVEAPPRVEKLVALTPVPANGYPFDARGYEVFVAATHDAEVRRRIFAKHTGNRLTPVWIEQMVRDSFAQSKQEVLSSYLASWARSDFSERIKGNPVPILVIIGEHDPAINEALVGETFLAWYPNVEFEIMTNAGHYPMFETPVTLATSVERFLRG